jgi:hypothetical protein
MTQKRKLQVGLVIVFIVGVGIIFSALTAYAQGTTNPNCPNSHTMGSQGMMNGSGSGSAINCPQTGTIGMGMMGSQGMMNGSSLMGNGMMGGQGMMGGSSMMGQMGRFGPGTGMMGAWTPSADLLPTSGALTLDQAKQVAQAYIAAWNSQTPLELDEVIQFDNQFYALARETGTGKSAFEFLIDPTSGTVYAEPGPNMMWNLRYGMMNFGLGQAATSSDQMTVTPDLARQYAQAYLDKTLPETEVADTADTFYGYYTLEILRDGKTTGMLSVNGYTGQVWLHTWHGQFVAASE